MSPRGLIRCVALALLASVPFVVAARAGQGLVAPLSAYGVRWLLRATAALAAPAPGSDEVAPEAEASAASTPAQPVNVAGKPAHRASKVDPAPLSALYVSQAKVLELAQSTARPRGAFVAASSQHPAGLQLSGVAALGIGVKDGDILIEALGATPRSAGQVIGAIIEARAQKARALSGTLWRQGQTLRIVVEQPYLQASSLPPVQAVGVASSAD